MNELKLEHRGLEQALKNRDLVSKMEQLVDKGTIFNQIRFFGLLIFVVGAALFVTTFVTDIIPSWTGFVLLIFVGVASFTVSVIKIRFINREYERLEEIEKDLKKENE